ncbi:hypothetical protein Tco_1266703, partial [Tanacetum coccineum]
MNAGRQNKNQAFNAGNGLNQQNDESNQIVQRVLRTELNPGKKPRVHDAKYFREKMLLAMKDEAGSNLNAEENAFMLDNSFRDETLKELIATAHEQVNHVKRKTINHTSDDDQIDSDIIFDDPYVENNGGTSEHDSNDHDEYHNIQILAYNVQKEAESQKQLNNELKKQKELLQKKLETCKERVKKFELKTVQCSKYKETWEELEREIHADKDTIERILKEKYKIKNIVDLEEKLSSHDQIIVNVNDENMLLKTQVDFVVKERENIKLEYQKLCNSIKATWTQHQKEVDELIEHVNQKTYAYGDVRSQNQDLLMTISELKNKLKTIKKGKNVNSNFDKSKTLTKLLCVTPFPNNIVVQAKKVSNTKVNAYRSKTVTSHSTPKNEQSQKQIVESSNSVRGPNSKDTKSKNRVLKNTNVKSSSAHVQKVFSSVNIDSNKHETMNSTMCLCYLMKNVLLVMLCLEILSGCLKHMTGNRSLLRNFVKKFMGTIRFRNDHFAAITGYGDYVQGNLTICHVNYVEGLGHNVFSAGQFCDGDLEVAFRSNTCYV